MAIITHTVSINAAFLQEIKEDHHELRQLMHHTEATLSRPDWMKVEYDRLVEMLGKLRDQLAMHFSLEEAFGCFEDALSVAPHLARRSEQLRAQHFALFSELCRLEDQAEQLLYHEAPATAVQKLAHDYRDFSARFRVHEAAESELVLEAVNADIGGED